MLVANSDFLSFITVLWKTRNRTCSLISYFPKLNPETPPDLRSSSLGRTQCWACHLWKLIILLGQWLIINKTQSQIHIWSSYCLQLLVLYETSFNIKLLFHFNQVCVIMVDSLPHLPKERSRIILLGLSNKNSLDCFHCHIPLPTSCLRATVFVVCFLLHTNANYYLLLGKQAVWLEYGFSVPILFDFQICKSSLSNRWLWGKNSWGYISRSLRIPMLGENCAEMLLGLNSIYSSVQLWGHTHSFKFPIGSVWFLLLYWNSQGRLLIKKNVLILAYSSGVQGIGASNDAGLLAEESRDIRVTVQGIRSVHMSGFFPCFQKATSTLHHHTTGAPT